MATDLQIGKLEESLEYIANTNLESNHPQLFTSQEIRGCREDFRAAGHLAKDLSGWDINWALIPDRVLNQLLDLFQNLRNSIHSLTLHTRETDQEDEAFEIRGLASAFTNAWGEVRRSEAVEYVGALHKQTIDQIDRVRAGIQNTAFGKLAKAHQKAAGLWLLGATTLMAGLIVILYRFYDEIVQGNPDPATALTPQLIQLVGVRVVLVSVLFTGMMWAGRNYRMNRHMEVINLHRQTTLEVLPHINLVATQDPQTKGTILLETTRVITAHTMTGLLGKDEEVPTNPVLEMIQKLVAKQ